MLPTILMLAYIYHSFPTFIATKGFKCHKFWLKTKISLALKIEKKKFEYM